MNGAPRPIASLADATTIIVPGILVPPSTVDQTGAISGVPVPDTSNVDSVASPLLSGSFIPETPGATLVIQAGHPKGRHHTMKLRRITLASDDGAPVGVEPQFKRWPSSSYHQLATPQGRTGAWTALDQPQLFVGGDGYLYCVYAAINPDGSGDSELVARRYEESLHEDWQHHASSGSLRALLQPAIGPNLMSIGALAALPVGRAIYALAFCTDSDVCQFHLLRLSGGAWSVVSTVGARTSGYALISGASAIALPFGGYLAAFGVRTTDGATTPGRFDVRLAYSDTLDGWSDDLVSGVVSMPRPADVREIALPVVYGTEPRRRDRHDITKIRMIDAAFGWAVTAAGAILNTVDGGASWTMQRTPSHATGNPRSRTHPLRNVAGYRYAGGDYVGYAVGDGGLILKTDDSGSNWKVLRYGAEALFRKTGGSSYEINSRADGVDFFDSSAVIPTAPGTGYTALDLYAIAVDPVSLSIVVAGAQGVMQSSVDGGTTWVTLSPSNVYQGDGTVRELIADRFDNYVALGDSTAFLRWGTDAHGKNAAFISRATTTSPLFTFFAIGDRANLVAAECPTRESTGSTLLASGYVYAVSSDAEVYRWNNAGSERIATLGGAHGAQAYDLSAFGVDANQSQPVVVVGRDARSGWGFWRCEAAQVPLNLANPEQSPVFVFNALSTSAIEAKAVDMTGASSAIVGARSHVYLTANLDSDRAYPYLYVTSRGTVMLMSANMTTGVIEVLRGAQPDDGGLPRFERVLGDHNKGGQATFGKPSLLFTIPNSVPRPCMTEDDLGQLILVYGSGVRVSVDDGVTWLDSSHRSLPFPVGAVQAEPLYSSAAMRTSRNIARYGHRLFSAVVNAAYSTIVAGTRIGTFVSREWSAGGVPLPVPFDKPATLYHGVRATWLGSPVPGDTWTQTPEYRYPARNILVESPSIYWRGPSNGGTVLTPETVLLFDRQAQVVVDQLGAGNLWGPIHGFACFGNFERVKFAISDPGDDSLFTEYESTSQFVSGMAAAISAHADVVRDSTTPTPYRESSRLAPHRLACPVDVMRDILPAYMSINDVDGDRRVYRIVDNDGIDGGVNYLLNTSLAAQVPGQIASAYRVWLGAHVWTGVGGSGNGSAGLSGSASAYGRYVRITIPEQPTAEGYFVVRQLVVGPSFNAAPPNGSTDWGRSLGPGFVYSELPNTAETAALNGASAVEHFDRIQSLAFGVQAAPRWYVDRLAGLIGRRGEMRRAMCWMFDASNPNTARLMRLADGPVYTHLHRDLFNIEATLRGVP